jgi:vancomycin resistance protein YoaR
MNKKFKISLVFSAALLLLGGGIALAYAIDRIPETDFVQKFSVPQRDFTEFRSFAEVNDYINTQETAFLESKILWTSERGEIELSLDELGVYFPTHDINNFGKKFMSKGSILSKAEVFLFGKEFKLEPKLRDDELKLAFAESGIEQGQASASFVYENGEVQIQAEQIGYGIDASAIDAMVMQFWLKDYSAPASRELPLRSSSPLVLKSNLEPLLPTATEFAARSISFLGEYDDAWEIPAKDHLNWLELQEDSLVLNKDAALTSFNEIVAPEVEKEAASVTITEVDGAYTFEGSARFGKEVNRIKLGADLLAWMAEPSIESISLEISEIEPEVKVSEELAVLGVTDLLEFGFSNFSGSPANRIHNIQVGMDKFNGILLAPGEEFSFTTLMGPIDAANGWLPELVIKGDETKPEYGGGLCQVSSTMFRAALYTGMDVTARKNHSYAVSYYARPNGYGLDATIYDPAPDFRFVNDSPGHLLIQGYIEGAHAYFVFYGTNDGRSVEMEGPVNYAYNSISETQVTYTDQLAPGVRQVTDQAHTGFQTDWWRTISYGDGTSSDRENFHSYYQARPLKVLEGRAKEE